MKAEKISLGIGVLVIILLAFLIVWKADILGVAENRLVQDARKSQNIESDWEVALAVNEDIGAMIFYDEDKEEFTYSIYLSREGMSYGYFFRQGGFDPYMAEDVKGVIYEDKGVALLSMNQDKVCRIVVGNDDAQQVIQVDPSKPFAVVLPIDCGEITMYDAQENVVTLYDTYTG